jgi:hypothetical protein
MDTEQYCQWVSSNGIAKACDIWIKNDLLYDEFMAENQELHHKGEDRPTVIYFKVDLIHRLKKDLHLISAPFILVSGDNDTTNPDELFANYQEFLSFIESPTILKWYSQNCIEQHPKLVKIPIGLDYHTIYNNPGHRWGAHATPMEQEQELSRIKQDALPFFLRKPICYSNFHFIDYGNKFGYTRMDVINQVPHHLVYYEPRLIPRIDTWNNQVEYTFVLSPHGNGLDCHRTWEALVLGCIVVVKTSPLDILYKDLPVLIVNDWKDVDSDLLEKTIMNFKERTFDFVKLTLDYYMSKIRRAEDK